MNKERQKQQERDRAREQIEDLYDFHVSPPVASATRAEAEPYSPLVYNDKKREMQYAPAGQARGRDAGQGQNEKRAKL
jgi:hypothetical protein